MNQFMLTTVEIISAHSVCKLSWMKQEIPCKGLEPQYSKIVLKEHQSFRSS